MQKAISTLEGILEEMPEYNDGSMGATEFTINTIKRDFLKEIIERLKALPKEQSVEDILERMPEGVFLSRCDSGLYQAYIQNDDRTYFASSGKTPQEALLKLEEQLNR